MTIKELRTALDSYLDNAEVKLLVNPQWPYETGISHLNLCDDKVYIIEDCNSNFWEKDSQL